LQYLAIRHYGLATLGKGDNMVILMTECPMTATQYVQYRIPHCIEPPPCGVSLGYQYSLIPAYLLLCFSEHAVVGLLIFYEFLHILIEDCFLQALLETVERGCVFC
jgi:hypothetical protein